MTNKTVRITADEVKASSRRMKALMVNADMLVPLLTTGSVLDIVDGLPADAEVVALERGSVLDNTYNTFFAFIESPEFPEVPNGDIIPRIYATVKRLQ